MRRTAQLAHALAVSLILMILGVQATAAPTETTPPQRILTVGIVNDIDSLNPFVGYVVEAYEVWGLMYDSLTGYGQKDFAAVPGLAEKWSTSADGKTWTSVRIAPTQELQRKLLVDNPMRLYWS